MSIVNSNELYNKWLIHINKQNSYMQTGGSQVPVIKVSNYSDTSQSIHEFSTQIGQLNQVIKNIKDNINRLDSDVPKMNNSAKELEQAKKDIKKSIADQEKILKQINQELYAIKTSSSA